MALETVTASYGWLKERHENDTSVFIPGIAPNGSESKPIYIDANGQTQECGVLDTQLKNALTFGSKTYDGSSAQEIKASDLGLIGAMVFLGSSTTAITDGGIEKPTIGGTAIATSNLQAGNVVLYNGQEFVWANSKWELLGDEGSHALKTIKIVGDGTVLTGGGTLEANRTISHAKKYGSTDTTTKYTSANSTTSITGGTSSVASGTIKIPQLKVDEYGHVISASDEEVTIKMPDFSSINADIETLGNKTYFIEEADKTNGITKILNHVEIEQSLDVNTIKMNDSQFIFSDNPNASGEANILAKIDSNGITANNFNGNATTATSFKEAKKVKLTGDVTGEASDTGANGWTIATTVADDSHNHIISNIDNLQSTLDGKQPNITGGASTITSQNLTANRALISNSSGKVAVSDITNTELNYLDGVTSNIQTQLNSKQATITGGASSITSSNLTASRALVSDSSGKVAVSAVTSTELGYLDGVTSAVQTQLNDLGTRATALETKTQYIKDVNTSTGYTNFLNNVSIAKKLEVGEGFVLNDDEFTFCDNPDASGDAEIIARINADGITATNFIGDGRVNKVAHHYKPDKNGITVTHSHVASNNAAWGSTNLITQIKTDLAGHVTGVTSAKLPANPDTGATSVEVVGDGNAVTTASYNSSNRKLTLTKGVDYKPVQSAVNSPSASGSTTAFIDSISQNANGVITATKKNVDFSNYQPKGNYKTTQTAVSDPTASGTSNTFISSISQDANGKITATKATVPVTDLSNYPTKDEVSGAYLPIVGGTITGTTDSSSTATGALIVKGGVGVAKNLYASAVHGAVWNDYAEFRQLKEEQETPPYGRVVIENGDDSLSLSTDRLQPGGNICSDTFGFAIGETKQATMPIAVSGRALAYPAEDRNSYCAGDAVCTGPNGTVSKMTREEIREWPDRIIGYVSAIPNYETWGQNNVSVDGRIWIKVI